MSYTHSYFKDNKLKDRTVSDPAFVIPPSPAVDDYADANELNQYASAVGEVLAYDLNGNLIRRELPTGDVDSYTYDPENRLISADIQSRGKTASYTYDALDRRATKTVDGLVTAYLYDGQDVIAEYDGAGALLRRFVYGPGVDEPIVMIDAGGAKSFYHADRLGSIAALTDEAGATAVIYPYDPYGNTDADDVGNPYRYTARRFDEETGLYYYRARYYATDFGRFLQTDPIGFEDDLNLYAYVGNDPVNGTDPSGKVCVRAPSIGNSASAFCQRSIRFQKLANDPAIANKTSFFTAASVVTNTLASKDLPGAGALSGISTDTSKFLDKVSATLEIANTGVAAGIRSGSIFSEGGSVAQNDEALVRFEQGIVQDLLDQLASEDGDAFDTIIGEINGSLNDLSSRALTSFADSNFAAAVSSVRDNLGRDIDFANRSDREAIGNELARRAREDRNQCTTIGSRIRSC